MLGKGLEIAILMEQLVSVLDAVRCNQDVDRSADGDSKSSQMTIVSGSERGCAVVEHRRNLETTQIAFDALSMAIVACALKHFEQDQVANDDRSRIAYGIKLVHCFGGLVA